MADEPIEQPDAPVAIDFADAEASTAPDWTRKYPPLLTIAIGLLIAVLVLPSSLNLPQSNPTQTVEYAPLPPDDKNQTPPNGNLSALGLGNSSGIQGEGAGGGNGANGAPPPPPDITSTGRNASTKNCVGNPPRQTEDPLSPPCVAYFKGDNFGATYQGVTGNEVRILVYVDPITFINGSDANNQTPPGGSYFDVDRDCSTYDTSADKKGCQQFETQSFRVWERYFNDRFQTYGRHVHFIVYYSNIASAKSADTRQAEAAENYQKVRPFAVVSYAYGSYEDTYLRAMADRQVLNFGSLGGREASFYNEHPKLIWGYQPTVEHQADGYASYVCEKMNNRPAAFAGAPLQNQPRTFGMVGTGDPGQSGFLALESAIKTRIHDQCGINLVDSAQSHTSQGCLFQDTGNAHAYGAQAMSKFVQENITTILWPGCTDPEWLKSAQATSYTPEWVLLGDGELDAPYPITLMQGANELDRHGIVITPLTYKPPLNQQRCYQAFREADPSFNEGDLGYICDDYDNLFQLFTGIQVAGPRLGPSSIDQGFHAIPAHPSGDPQVPACFYQVGDYSCVKDAQAMWFDKNQSRPGSSRPGCWHSIHGGARSLPGKWPDGNAGTDWSPNDPCNGYDSGAKFTT